MYLREQGGSNAQCVFSVFVCGSKNVFALRCLGLPCLRLWWFLVFFKNHCQYGKSLRFPYKRLYRFSVSSKSDTQRKPSYRVSSNLGQDGCPLALSSPPIYLGWACCPPHFSTEMGGYGQAWVRLLVPLGTWLFGLVSVISKAWNRFSIIVICFKRS